MCGIAGQVTSDRRPVDRRTISAMGRRLQHRGPDDSGIYVEGHVGLAHQRLSVLDLSPAGHQPMSNDNRTIWIVFNGEIYNFKELRAALRPRYTFRSSTDTEVILRLYEDQGLHCLSMLRGMFAFAIWDYSAKRLILVRDRLGKKPLFYCLTDQGLYFASELKALLSGGVAREIDPIAIHHYLTFQYIPAPMTIFKGIRKLLPGHVLLYEDGKLTERTYWSLDYTHKRPLREEKAYREKFFALLEESVKIRLSSDVPLGAFLSGGLDSSSVVALMSRLAGEPVKTFSIGFKDDAFNELPYAREVAQRFHTEHHEFIVEPSAVELLPTLVGVYDEPYADSSAIPTYYVAQRSRQYVTVILNGDGGDEILAGYPRYRCNIVDRALARILSNRVRQLLQQVILKSSVDWHRLQRVIDQIRRILEPFSTTYLGRICYFSSAEKDRLYAEAFSQLVQKDDSGELLARWFESVPAFHLLDQLLGVDTRSYLPDDLLVKVDRATMAHGLEARSPFLDHRLVEFAASLPVHMKVWKGEAKYLLKSAMRGILPDRILDRPKMGFGVPIDRWFREECRTFLVDTLLSSRCLMRGYFKPEFIRQMIHLHHQQQDNYGFRLYALLMLELWHREYIDEVEA